MGTMGKTRQPKTQVSGPCRAADLVFVGADDEIRTRDPHLGKKKVRMTVRTVRLLLRSIPQSPKPSGKSVCSVQFVYRSTIALSRLKGTARLPTQAATPSPDAGLRACRRPLVRLRTGSSSLESSCDFQRSGRGMGTARQRLLRPSANLGRLRCLVWCILRS